MEQEVKPADKQYRKRILLWILVIFLVGVGLIQVFQTQFLSHMQGDNLRVYFLIFKWVFIVILLLPLILGFRMLSIANQTLRENCYPPERLKVLRDTPVIRDKQARDQAYRLMLFAFIIFFLSLFSAFSAHLLLKLFMNS